MRTVSELLGFLFRKLGVIITHKIAKKQTEHYTTIVWITILQIYELAY